MENIIDFRALFQMNDRQIIEWCLEHRVLIDPVECPICRVRMQQRRRLRLSGTARNKDRYQWRCSLRSCGFTKSIRSENNFFSILPRVSIRIILLYAFTHFVYMISPQTSRRVFGLTFAQIRKMANFLGNWIVDFVDNDDNAMGQLGGIGMTVEIDESCFFKRKNNMGRILRQVWGLGIIERESGRIFARVVPDRSANTLLPLIQEWVSDDTDSVCTDGWRGYLNLANLGYNHNVVIHERNFINPDDDQIHTQNIENLWGRIKALLRRRGRISRINFPDRLKEITWRLNYGNLIQENLLHIIQNNV